MVQKVAQTLIEDNKEMEKEYKKQMDKMQRKMAHVDKKLDMIQTQTKKKTPVKRQPKPKEADGEDGLKKKVFTGSAIKKLILQLK